MLRGDEGLDVGEAGVGVVEPYDLEHAPAGRLQLCCAVEQAGRLQPFPLAGQRAGVLLAVPARITQPGVRLVEAAVVSRWKAWPSNSTLGLTDGGLRKPLPLDSTSATARSAASWTSSVVARR